MRHDSWACTRKASEQDSWAQTTRSGCLQAQALKCASLSCRGRAVQCTETQDSETQDSDPGLEVRLAKQTGTAAQ
eukprot:1161225-Pelagomonas_calceolata.AAC.5